MKNLIPAATLFFLILLFPSDSLARDAGETESKSAQIDSIIFRLFQYDAKFPRSFCGVDYRGPSEEERKASLEMQEFRAQAKQRMKEMGPQAIPLMLEGLNANCRLVKETMIETMSELGQPVFKEIENGLNDGRISDFRKSSSDFHEVIEILKKSKSDYSSLITNAVKSKNLNCRLFALKAMSKLEKNFPELDSYVEKSACDIHENIRAAAIAVLALDARSNKSHFEMVMQAIENDETSLVRSQSINAMSAQLRQLNNQDKSRYEALLAKIMQTDHVKKVRDYASYSFTPARRKQIFGMSDPLKFSLSSKDSIYSSPLPKPQILDDSRKAALDASVSSILYQIKNENAQLRANYNPRANSTPEYRGSSSFNYYKYDRFIRSKEMELRNLGAEALSALIKFYNSGNADASASCASTIFWYDYASLPLLAETLESGEGKQSFAYIICGAGARSNAVFEQILNDGSDNAKLNALAILSFELPRQNYHKSIPHPIEVTPKLIRLIEKCMASKNTRICEVSKIVREQIDFSQCSLLVRHH